MKRKILHIVTAVTLLSIPKINFGQAPNLGTAVNFALFTTVGPINISGISQLTGNVGSNSGSTTVFTNVNGSIHDQDGTSGQCASDLLLAYNQISATVPTATLAPSLGNGQSLFAGVYNVSGATVMGLDLTLNAQGNPNAVFIFQILGSLSTSANTKVTLTGGAQACNVFWQVEGLVSMATGTTMRGTVIANNAAINMSAGDTLEGRALSTSGALTIDGSMVYTPIGCGSPFLTGPIAPALASTECYALFSADGPVQNSGPTFLTGDVGTNVGLTTGFDTLNVIGKVHPIADGSTSQCAADLLNVSNYLNALTPDIELMYPPLLGNNLVLTPHTYVINGATTFTDTLYLNAQGNANAVFVIQIYGALSTSTYSKVILTNGTQAKNVYWEVNGAVSINDYSVFNGTIIANNGAIDLETGVVLNGRALSTTGALTITAVGVIEPNAVGTTGTITGMAVVCVGQTNVLYSVPTTTNAINYSWILPTGATIISGANTNSILVDFGSSATSGTITAQGGNNCSAGTASMNFSVTVNPLPDAAGIITGNAAVCQGQTGVTYSVSVINNASAYIWTLPTGATITSGATTNSIVVDFSSSAASGTVTVQGNNGCGNGTVSADFTVSVCGTTGITSVNSTNNAVTIYPNPFSTTATIVINDASQLNTAELKMYNVFGAEVMSTPITKQLTTLETSNLSSGIYFYNVILNNKTIQSGKLISQQ